MPEDEEVIYKSPLKWTLRDVNVCGVSYFRIFLASLTSFLLAGLILTWHVNYVIGNHLKEAAEVVEHTSETVILLNDTVATMERAAFMVSGEVLTTMDNVLKGHGSPREDKSNKEGNK